MIESIETLLELLKEETDQENKKILLGNIQIELNDLQDELIWSSI